MGVPELIIQGIMMLEDCVVTFNFDSGILASFSMSDNLEGVMSELAVSEDGLELTYISTGNVFKITEVDVHGVYFGDEYVAYMQTEDGNNEEVGFSAIFYQDGTILAKTVDEVTSGLLQRGFVTEALHGDMKQLQRERVMARFKAKQVNILVASDVAARGLDVNDVDVVFNYDLPQEDEYYVHRIGRTGRAKREGVAISLISGKEIYRLKSIMKYTKAEINPIQIPSLDHVIKSRVERIIKGAKTETTKNINNKYFKAIRKAIYELASEDISAEEIITGLILQQMNIDQDEEVVEVKNALEKTNSSKKKDIIRFFINIGKKDKIKVYNLTDMIVKRTRLSNADINNVDIHDEFSFFEVPRAYENEIYAAFNRKEKNGRKIVVEESRPKEKTGKGKTRGGAGRKRRSK